MCLTLDTSGSITHVCRYMHSTTMERQWTLWRQSTSIFVWLVVYFISLIMWIFPLFLLMKLIVRVSTTLYICITYLLCWLDGLLPYVAPLTRAHSTGFMFFTELVTFSVLWYHLWSTCAHTTDWLSYCFQPGISETVLFTQFASFSRIFLYLLKPV